MQAEEAIDNCVNLLFPVESRQLGAPLLSYNDALASIEKTDAEGNFFLSFLPIVPSCNPLKRNFYEGVPTLNTTAGKIGLNHREMSASQTPIGRELDIAILEHAFLNLTHSPNLMLKINMSAMSLADPSWRQKFIALTTQHGAASKRLTLCFFEGSLLEIPDILQVFLRDAAGLNINFGISDFGAGFCSLRALKDLPFDLLCIDPDLFLYPQLFPNIEKLLKAISNLCRCLGFESLAPGIDDERTFLLAQKTGWDWIQGSYISIQHSNYRA